MTALTHASARPRPARLVRRDNNTLVDATPFRAWLRQLMSETGQPWRVIAKVAGISPAVTRALILGHYGRPISTIRAQDAWALLGVQASTFDELARRPADVLRLRSYLLAMRAEGLDTRHLASFAGVAIPTVTALLDGTTPWVSRLTQIRVAAAYEARHAR